MNPSSFRSEIESISNGDELFTAFEKLDEFAPEERGEFLSLLLKARARVLGPNS
jgi:hypothetical protein